MNKYDKEFYELSQLLGGYFFQNWSSAFLWNGQEANFETVVMQYKTEEVAEGVEKAIQQLKQFLSLPLQDKDFDKIVDYFTGSGFSPLETRRAFLERVLEILKEPRPTKPPLTRK